MAVQSGSSQTFLPAYQENYLKDLLANAAALGTQGGMEVPEYKIADMTPLQKQAIQMGAAGLGAYAPFFQSAAGTLGKGAEAIAGSTGTFDPRSVSQFMDPYTEDVIRQSEKDIARLGTKQQQGLRDRAVAAGAFGGGRQAIGEAEVGRNVLDQQARTGAQLRSQGYQQAMGQAQAAFENQQRRQQQAGQIFGGLGQATAQLGLGLQGAQQRDVSSLLGLGGLEQAQQQAGLDAFRRTAAERARSPYQNLGFLSDIFRGVPSTGGTYTQQFTQDPSMLSQVAGLGLGLAGLGQAYPKMFSGIFGEPAKT
tara:strand:+ start:138 stop:1064 length:927 start_codon:yes stop_codon:yes gene_type:complete